MQILGPTSGILNQKLRTQQSVLKQGLQVILQAEVEKPCLKSFAKTGIPLVTDWESEIKFSCPLGFRTLTRVGEGEQPSHGGIC